MHQLAVHIAYMNDKTHKLYLNNKSNSMWQLLFSEFPYSVYSLSQEASSDVPDELMFIKFDPAVHRVQTSYIF